MLTKKTPETFKAIGNVRLPDGKSTPIVITYYNKTQDQLNEAVSDITKIEVPEDYKQNSMVFVQAQILLVMVKSFDDGTEEDFPLTLDGLLDMENHYHEILGQLINFFHIGRKVAVEKN